MPKIKQYGAELTRKKDELFRIDIDCNKTDGWALLQPRNQSCPKCGAGLLITEDGKKTIQGYSPFTAEEYKMKLPPGVIPDPKITKDNAVKE